jgi:tetratricopeptide (TPR) repeat protein
MIAPAVVHADEATARKAFDEGERAYNLGDFPKAVELFRKAFEEWPEPAFLFNLAQTYRQMGDCKQASFFYKRFLALKEQDTKKPIKPALKAEVETRIGELEECIKRELASKPPTELDKGGGGTGGTDGVGTGGTGGTSTATGPGTGGGTDGTGGDGDGNGDGDGDGGAAADAGTPKLFSLRLGLGAGRFAAGDLTTLQFATSLLGGYPLSINEKLRLELGAALTFLPVPYTTTGATPESGTASLIGLAANVAPVFEIAPKIYLRADVGLGLQLFSGLTKMNNPFTEGGAPASGALSTFMLRMAVSGEYAVTPNIALTLTPFAFSYSPAPDGFDPSISSVTTISFLAGVGYHR